MKKLLLPLVIGSALSLTACCECKPIQGKLAENNKKHENKDAQDKKQAQEQAGKDEKASKGNKDASKTATVAAAGALAVGAFDWDKLQANGGAVSGDIANLGSFPYFKTPEGMKLVTADGTAPADQPASKTIEGTTLNLFDGKKVASETGKLSYLNFIMAEDGKDFDKAGFDSTVTDFMKAIGAVEFYNDEVPAEVTETIVKMDDDKTTHNQEYMDGEGADFKGRSVRQFAVKGDNGKLIYQVMSDDAHGEVGVLEVEGFVAPTSAPAQEATTDADAENAKKQAEEDAKKKAEEEAKQQAEEEAKQKAELEAKKKAEEEKAKAEADKKAEEAKAEESKKPTASEMTEEISKSGKMILNINFDTAKSSIKQSDVTLVDEIYKVMKDDPSLKLSIEGHTDSSGSKAMNQKLSESRAKTVKSELEKKGIDTSRLKATGYGESKPIASNNTAEGKAKNRRVELVKFD